MSKTYLQDFGLLRKQANAREVNDPMSGAGRWDDLQLDLRKPHIPKPRRNNMPANRRLTVAGVTIDITKPDVQLTKALGFTASVPYKHRLVTPKADTYRRSMQENPPDQTKLLLAEEPQPYSPFTSVRQAIRHYVAKARFSRLPSVANLYRAKIRILWPVRRIK